MLEIRHAACCYGRDFSSIFALFESGCFCWLSRWWLRKAFVTDISDIALFPERWVDIIKGYLLYKSKKSPTGPFLNGPRKNLGFFHSSSNLLKGVRWDSVPIQFLMDSCAVFFLDHNTETILPRNLTWNLKMMVSKRNHLFQGLLFRFHVKFQGCTWALPCGCGPGLRRVGWISDSWIDPSPYLMEDGIPGLRKRE